MLNSIGGQLSNGTATLPFENIFRHILPVNSSVTRRKIDFIVTAITSF